MSNTQTVPSYNAKRRIQWLAAAIVVFCGLYTAGWFYAASKVDAYLGEVLSVRAAKGEEITCAERDVRGYPFRIGVFCEDTDVRIGEQHFDAGALRSAAQVYDPTRAVIELDGPLVAKDAGLTINADWKLARAVTDFNSGQLASLNVEVEQGVLTHPLYGEISSDKATYFSRDANNGAELGLRANGVRVSAGQLPPLNIVGDVTVDDVKIAQLGATSSLFGRSGQIRHLGFSVTDDQGVIVTGPYSLSETGKVTGDFEIRVVDVPGLIESIRSVSPDLAGQIGLFLSAGQKGEREDERVFTIPVRDGKARFGFFEFGGIQLR